MFNSNAFHNIANIATLILAMTTAGLIASGCTATVNGFDCSASWLSPSITLIAIGVVQVLKMAVNVLRDGIDGLFKPQPPVQK